MKKRRSKKLSLNRETVRRLSDTRLTLPAGGAPTNGNGPDCRTNTCDRVCLTFTDCC